MIIKKLNFYGLSVSSFTKKELTEFIHHTVVNSKSKIFYGYSLWTIFMIRKYRELLIVGNDADLIVADGKWFFWLINAYRYNIPYEISIPQLVLHLLKVSNDNNYSLSLWGATESVNAGARNNIRVKYPKIRLRECFSGFFNEDKKEEIIRSFMDDQPDILLIGIYSPLKEQLATQAKHHMIAKHLICK